MHDDAMQFTRPLTSDDRDWLSLRSKLWPGPESEHLRYMADAFVRGHHVLIAIASDGVAVGFVEASMRVDYVNGTSTSPVAFLEGLYVEPSSRRNGVARELVAAIARWAETEGCTELASDSPVENVVAHVTHRALGFEETERVVYFRRAVRDN